MKNVFGKRIGRQNEQFHILRTNVEVISDWLFTAEIMEEKDNEYTIIA